MSRALPRDGRGLALPSWLVAVSAVLVALALVGFAVTGDRDPDVVASDPDTVTAIEPDTSVAPRGDSDGPEAPDGRGDRGDRDVRQDPDDRGTTDDDPPADDRDPPSRPDRPGRSGPDRDDRDEPVERRTAPVEVYNNSAITGLAGGTAATLQDTGWQVVATDNWYGDIPNNTVYYPPALADQAELLAGDLGIGRLMPAVDPMRGDALTVILTATP